MKFSDRVKETTVVTDTTTINLAGAASGFNPFSSAGTFAVGTADIPVCVQQGSLWEIGLYTLSSANVLTRQSILASSNNGAAVAFTAGSKDVFNTIPASFVAGTTIDGLESTTSVVDADLFEVFKTAGGESLKVAFSVIANEILSRVPAGGDTTPPTLQSPTASSTGATTGSGSVTTNEANGTLYYLATVNATETAATVKASGATQSISSIGSKNVSLTNLAASTTYYLHFVHRDATGNDSVVVTSAAFTTSASADTTAPSLTSPTATQTGTTTASGSVTTNEANGTLYRYASTNAVESVATIKGANLATAVTATGAQNVTFSGLTANTTYYAHFVHTDAAGNNSTVSSSGAFTTAAEAGGGATATLVSREQTTASGGTYTGTNTGASISAGLMSGGVLDKVFMAGQDGSFMVTVADLSAAGTGAKEVVVSVGPEDFSMRYGAAAYALLARSTGYVPYENGPAKTALNGVLAAVGDVIKFERVGTVLTASVSKNGGTTFTDIYKFTVPTSQLFGQVFFANQAAINNIQCTGLGTATKTPIRFTSLAGITEGGSAGAYTYSGNGTVAAFSTSQTAVADKMYDGAKNGSFTMPLLALGTGRSAIASSGSAVAVAPASTYIGGTNEAAQWNSFYQGNTSTPLSVIVPATGDLMRVTRMGIVHRVGVSKDNGETFTCIKEFQTGNTTSNNFQLFLTGTTTVGPVVGTGVV